MRAGGATRRETSARRAARTGLEWRGDFRPAQKDPPMITKLVLPLLLLAATPQPGSYGFNWLDAKSTCKPFGAKELAKLSKCTVSPNAFGLDVKAHQCKVSAKVEWVIYETKAQCQQALETMQSNGD
jgi:hypothetical protein